MKISYNWLKQYLKLDLVAGETGIILTDLGLEIEGIKPSESMKGGLKGVVVGLVSECGKHPSADKLKIIKVDVSQEAPLQIVCGAPNVAKGQKVPVVTIGTVLYDHKGKPLEIKKGKIRGEESYGMICAEDESGSGESHEGIMVLDDEYAVGTPCAEVFQVETDEVFEIGLTPNRADAMSHYGAARDLRAGPIQKGVSPGLITPSAIKSHVDNRSVKVDIEVTNKKLALCYTGAAISNARVGKSLAWLQNRLKAISTTPKNSVVDVTNYVLHGLGQPLHAFDADYIVGRKFIVKTAEAGTIFTTLDGIKRTLDAEDLIIYDAEKLLCITGVLGGQDSGVAHSIRNAFLESACFDSVSVRRTAKGHSISTNASYHFERGINIEDCKYALMYAAVLIKSTADGVTSSDTIDSYPKKKDDFQASLALENVDKPIGQETPRDTIKSISHLLDIKVSSLTERGLGLLILSYWVDVQREADVIEEILRIYGYSNISFSEKINASMLHSSKYDDLNMQNVIAAQLIGQGYYEIMTNSLVSEEKVTSYKAASGEAVKLLNPLSSDLGCMRANLLFSGLEVVSRNTNYKRSGLKLFEFGKNYRARDGKYDEQKHLLLYLTGNQLPQSWITMPRAASSFELKGSVETLFERLGLKKVTTLPLEPIDNVAAEGFRWMYGEILLETVGAAKHKIFKDFDIKQEVLYVDLYWETLPEQVRGHEVVCKEISKYPEVRRDLTLLLDDKVSLVDLCRVVFAIEKSILKRINSLDVYQGDKLTAGRKSYTVSSILQEENKTLTDKQADKTMLKLQTTFEQSSGVTSRE